MTTRKESIQYWGEDSEEDSPVSRVIISIAPQVTNQVPGLLNPYSKQTARYSPCMSHRRDTRIASRYYFPAQE